MIETEKFYVGRVERETNMSRELGSSRMAAVSLGAVSGLSARCKGCGAEWTASVGGGMTRTLTHMLLECPGCAAEELIASGVLAHAS